MSTATSPPVPPQGGDEDSANPNPTISAQFRPGHAVLVNCAGEDLDGVVRFYGVSSCGYDWMFRELRGLCDFMWWFCVLGMVHGKGRVL